MLKIINFFIFLKCFVFFLLKNKVKSFHEPPNNIVDIGFLDKNLMIHIQEKYKHYFINHDNMHKNVHYHPYKTDTIRLVLIDDKILIKKIYKGPLKKRVQFYNEIECLLRMSHLKNIPKIHFIDYDNLTIFLQYIDGDCLRNITETERVYPELISKLVKARCKIVLKKIHEHDIAVIDVWSHNIIYNPQEQDVFFIDFADSVCRSLFPRRLLKALQKRDEVKLVEEVLNKL